MSGFAAQELVCRRGERTIFADLSFTLRRGGALLLLGPNGSGKTTLLRCLAGLITPAAGAILWDGVRIDEDAAAHRRRLHYLGHQDAVKPSLTVAENLMFWANLRGTRRGGPGPRETVAHALSAFRLEPLARMPGRLLSAGQRRRVALARMLASPAWLWLLDEPTSSVDDASVNAFEAAVSAHREEGGIVVMATHGGPAPPGALRLHMANFRPASAAGTIALSEAPAPLAEAVGAR